jgi:hypothetical protein
LGGNQQSTTATAGNAQGAKITGARALPRRLAPREAAFVGAHPPIERAKGFGDDHVVLMTIKNSGNGRRLCFGHGGDFFDHHALSFALSAGAARGQSNHPQRHDALRVDAKLGSFKRYLDPWVEQETPVAREGE